MANDHYVPQFYLRNFAIPSKPKFVYSYRRNTKLSPRPISRVASAPDFYKVRWETNPELEPESLDRVYSYSESFSASIISKLLSGDENKLSGSDWGHLTWFVALLAGRVPLMREQYKNLLIATRKRDIKAFASRKEEFDEFAREFDLGLEPEEIEQRRQALLNFDKNLIISVGNDGETDYNLKGAGMALASPIQAMLAHRRWHLLESSGVRNFVTSDNPVVKLPPPGRRSEFGWGYHNSPLLVPISPRRAILIDDQLRSTGVVKVSREKMVEYIFYIVTQAHKSVFASNASAEVQKMFDKTVEEALTEVYLNSEPSGS
jgi:hypothetical protein